MIFKENKTYDILKWIAIMALPAIGWFYGEVGPAWGFPYINEITLTLDRLGLLLGILLGVSNYQYNKQQDNRDWAQMKAGSGDDWKGEE